MSTRLANINVANLTGQTIIDTLGVALAQCGWIEFLNESPYTIELQMGGVNVPIPAWYDYPIQLQEKLGGVWQPIGAPAFPPQITPTLLASTNSNLSTTLLTTLYLTGETPPVTTPQPLVRQTYVPNTVNTVGTQAETLVNTGNPGSPPLDVIFVNVNGDSENAVTLTNTASMGLGDTLYPGSLLIGGPGGSLVVDGTIESDNGAIVSNGAGQLTVVREMFTHGSISRMAIDGPFSVTSTATLFNHTLGVVPDFCFIWLGFASSATCTCTLDSGSMTSTQYKMQSNISLSPVFVLSIKQ